MVLYGCGTRCRVWHAELAFFVVVAVLTISCTPAADAGKQRNSQGLKIFVKHMTEW